MKILKGIFYLLGVLLVTGIVAVLGLALEINGAGNNDPIYPLEWLLKSRNAGFLYIYFALCFLLFAFGFRKAWFRFVFSRLFFVGIAYMLAGGWCVAFGRDLQGGYESYTFLEWLQKSPGSWLLYVYLILSLLFFHYGFHFASCFRLRRRISIDIIACVLFLGLFWLTSYSVACYYQIVHYEHQSDAEDNPEGERLQEQMALIISSITNSVYPDASEFKSRTAETGLFDPNYYFTVFTNLSLETGYELDYRFFRDWFAGEPLIYARKADGGSTSDDEDDAWYLKVHLNGSPASYMEYVVLYLFANEFYLSGHAVQYSEGRVVSSKTEFDELINGRLRPGPKSAQQACQIDFFPRVLIDDDGVEVSIVTFSSWGGLVRKTVAIAKDFPHQILEEDLGWETLIDYDCGIRF